jgi:endonuclease G
VLEAGASVPTYVEMTGAIVRPEGTLELPDVRNALHAAERRGIIRLDADVWRRTDTGDSHFLFGQPVAVDERHRFTPPEHSEEVEGITVLQRMGFTIGHYDQMKVPAWVAMKWTNAMFDESEEVTLNRGGFVQDDELPEYARASTEYLAKTSGYQRGHMARDADAEAWGMEGVREAMRMSNVVPQRTTANHRVWGLLEDEHRFIVQSGVDIETVWVISGPIFRVDEDTGDDVPLKKIANGVGVPQATYKVIAWRDEEGDLEARGFIIRQGAKSVDLEGYIETIDAVEEETGLDFFPELSDNLEAALESAEHVDLWGEFPEGEE